MNQVGQGPGFRVRFEKGLVLGWAGGDAPEGCSGRVIKEQKSSRCR